LIKLVFDEPGSDVAVELWDRAEAVVSSQLVYPEARAAIAAAHRSGRIDARTLRAAVRAIDELCRALDVIGLDEPLGRAAGALAERYALRGCDAVHLASAGAVDDPSLVQRDLGSRSRSCRRRPEPHGRPRATLAASTVADDRGVPSAAAAVPSDPPGIIPISHKIRPRTARDGRGHGPRRHNLP
jgi:uncharacterized protein